MLIPAINKRTNELVMLSTDEILYIAIEKELYFKNHMEVYRPLSTLNDYERLLQTHGFEMIERACLAQINRITRYDPAARIIYFDDPRTKTIARYVSRRHAHKLDHLN